MKRLLLLTVLISFVSAENNQWHSYDPSNSGITDRKVNKIVIDQRDIKWIGVDGRAGPNIADATGLIKFDGENWTVFDSKLCALPDRYFVSALCLDSKNKIWVGARMFLAQFDGKEFNIYTSGNGGLPNGNVTSVAFEGDTKWIGTFEFGSWGCGLAKLVNDEWTFYDHLNSDIPHDQVNAIVVDSDSYKWIGTMYGGIGKFDSENDIWKTYNKDNSDLPDNAVYALKIDSKGNIWAGTLGGAAKYDGQKWIAYTVENSNLPEERVFSIDEDDAGAIWFCTGGGVAKLYDNQWTFYNVENSGLKADFVTDIAFDSFNNKWFATDKGLSVFNEEGLTSIDQNIKNNNKGTHLRIADVGSFCSVEFSIQSRSFISLKLYDLKGKMIGSHLNQFMESGDYQIFLNRSGLPSGIFLLHYSVNGSTICQRINLMK